MARRPHRSVPSTAPAQAPDRRLHPIAIVGIGCRFPGDTNGAASFWRLLCSGTDAISEIPPDRWNVDAFYDPDPHAPGKSYARHGGFVRDIDRFDPAFFGISPREAGHMDPQQRIVLEVAWEALEDAGLPVDRRTPTAAGVFVGIANFDYAKIQRSLADMDTIEAHTATGVSYSIAANRISHALNLTGPSVAVDTACSSSLVAVHLACCSLINRECEIALAGGVNALLNPETYVDFCRLSMLAPDGRCKAFDASANGYVRGEGAGIVVLKPLAKALADGDRVWAVVLGSGTNQDGRTPGITMPSRQAQEALLRRVYTEAGVDPAEVGYFEAHGTGTPVGDPIEAAAIGSVVSAGRAPGGDCYLGSVKTNIGHLESAAGVAGLIKAALVLDHGRIPPNLHFTRPNEAIDLAALRLVVPTTLVEWPAGLPRIASVNSFGFGGANATVLMSSPQEAARRSAGAASSQGEAGETPVPVRDAELVCLSAETPVALRETARRALELLKDGTWAAHPLREIARTSARRRVHHRHRLAIATSSHDHLASRLETFGRGEAAPGMTCAEARPPEERRVAFVYSGQGPQWWGMGRRVIELEPVVRGAIEECDALFRRLGPWSLVEELLADETRSRLDDTAIAQPAIFALQVALTRLWQSWGIRPGAVVGHSVGEVAAAWASGMLSLEDAALVIFHRGRCMAHAGGRSGRMLAAGLTPAEAGKTLAGYEGRATIGAFNSPTSVTLSGDADALEAIERRLTAGQVFCRFLASKYAFHSHHMDGMEDELLSCLASIRPGTPAVPVYSTVTGQAAAAAEFSAGYWWRNVRQAVRFADGIGRLVEDHVGTFVEVGPHPVLAGSIAECLLEADTKGIVLPSLSRREPDHQTLLGSLGALHAQGAEVDWTSMYGGRGTPVEFPGHPWDHDRYFVQTEDYRDLLRGTEDHPLLGRRVASPQPCWEKDLTDWKLRYLADHCLGDHAVLPAAAYVEIGLAIGRLDPPGGKTAIESLRLHKALFVPSGTRVTLRTTYDPDEGTFRVHSRTGRAEWQLNATGALSAGDAASRGGETPDEIGARCPWEVPAGDLYTRFGASGLRYGPAFRGIVSARAADAEAIVLVRAPEALSGAGAGYHFQPALLDACFQAIGCPLGVDLRTAYLPVSVERVTLTTDPGSEVWSHVRIESRGPGRLRATVRVLDAGGREIAAIDGLECQPIEAGKSTEPMSLPDTLYSYAWVPKPLQASAVGAPVRLTVPALADLASEAAPKADPGRRLPNADLDELAATYIVNALVDLDWPFESRAVTIAEATLALKVAAPWTARLEDIFELLESTGRARRRADRWRLTASPRHQPTQWLWQSLLGRAPGLLAELTVLHRGGSQLAAILRGQRTAADAICPREDLGALQHLYEDSPLVRPAVLAAQEILRRLISARRIDRPFRILELTGARRAGSIASALVSAGEVECTLATPGRLPSGPDEGSFDIVVSRLALYSGGETETVLAQAARLAADEAPLLAIEPGRTPGWLRLVLGLAALAGTDGEPDNGLGTGAAASAWRKALAGSGWRLVGEWASTRTPQVGLTVAARVRRAAEWPATPEHNEPLPESRKTWLIFDDEAGCGSRLARILEGRSQRCLLVARGSRFDLLPPDRAMVDPASKEDLERLLSGLAPALAGSSLHGLVCLWPLDTAFDRLSPDDGGGDRLNGVALSIVLLAQALMAHSEGDAPRLYVVTAGAHAPDGGPAVACPFQSAIWGLGRTLANEFPQSRCTLVDLGRVRGGVTDAGLEALAVELLAGDDEDEVALREGARFVHRLGRVPASPLPNGRPARAGAAAPGFGLSVGRGRDIESLFLERRDRRPPRRGEVEIEVAAAGLNFSDVLKALGLYPGLGAGPVPIGLECAGVVTRVGPQVLSIEPGDRVMALAPFSLASHVIAPRHAVAVIPPWLDFAGAATIPVAFLTAYYALVTRGRLQPGERLLVHSASGGVGLAAIQIARQIGAEILATAGTPEKREFLAQLGVAHVMDSRSLAFARETMAVTGGEGVDAVLNSLAGEAIPKSLSLLRDYGRFLEIGKRDIYDDRRIGLAPFRRNLSFLAIDLDKTMKEQPEVVGGIVGTMAREVARRRFVPLAYRTFPVAAARAAFRTMAKARHTGKIVLSLGDHAPRVAPALGPHPRLSPEATYLVTGGFGGLGLVVARWLAACGARHLALVGRSGAASAAARAVVAQLARDGVEVASFKADASDGRAVARLVRTIGRKMPPLRGVIHAAAVLDDALVANLDGERIRRVLAPKAVGAWHLHRQTVGVPLDFFVLFSSVSSVIGMPGQASYVAANAFLDGLAAHRRAIGLPAVTINWGYIGEVGLAARNPETVARFENQGLQPISPAEALDLLAWFLAERPVQMTAVKMDWGRFGEVFRLFGRAPKFSPLFRGDSSGEGAAVERAGAACPPALDELPEAERVALVRALLREQVARVLGTGAEKLDFGTPLTDLGFDSLMAVELRNWLDSKFDVALPAVEVMRGPSIDQLSATVLRVLAHAGGDTEAPAAGAP